MILQQQSPHSNVFLLHAKKINIATIKAIPAGNKAMKNGKSLSVSGSIVVVFVGASVALKDYNCQKYMSQVTLLRLYVK